MKIFKVSTSKDVNKFLVNNNKVSGNELKIFMKSFIEVYIGLRDGQRDQQGEGLERKIQSCIYSCFKSKLQSFVVESYNFSILTIMQ